MFSVDAVARPSFSCVHFTEAGPRREDPEARGLFAGLVDGGAVEDDQALLHAIADAFGFPDYFGSNWDALEECLRDMSWAPADGYVLVVAGAEVLWRRDPQLAARLVSSWLLCAEDWAGRGAPFHLVFEW